MRKIIAVIILSLLCLSGYSQQNWLPEGAASTGFLIQHHSKDMAALAKERPYAYEFSLARQTDSTTSWAAFYNYPRYGMELLFLSPGNPKDIGYAFCALPYMRFSFFKNNNPFNAGVRIGAGVGYVTKPFEPDVNYKNTLIGRHWNAALGVNLDVETRLFDHLSVRSGIGIVHLSNGATKMPNWGINIFTASVGVGYNWDNGNNRGKGYLAPAFLYKKEKRIDIFLLGGQKESRILFDGEKYGVAAVSVQGSYRYAKCMAVGAGVDLFYDSSNRNEILKEDSATVSHLQTLKPGIALSHEFFFGRFSAFFQCGVYIHLNKYDKRLTYQRLAFRYTFNDRFRLHFGLKNYIFVADYMEFGLGIRIR